MTFTILRRAAATLALSRLRAADARRFGPRPGGAAQAAGARTGPRLHRLPERVVRLRVLPDGDRVRRSRPRPEGRRRARPRHRPDDGQRRARVLAEVHRPGPLPGRGRGDGLRRVGRRDERPDSKGPRPAPDARPGPLRGGVAGGGEADREIHPGDGQGRGPGSPGRPRPLGLLGVPPLRQRLLQRRGIDLEQVVLRIGIRQPDDRSLEGQPVVQRQLQLEQLRPRRRRDASRRSPRATTVRAGS